MNMLRKSALVAGLVASCAGMATGRQSEPCERGPFPLAVPDARVCRSILDFNQDDFVDFFDEMDFESCFVSSLPGCPSTDMNCDGFVDFNDYDLFSYAWDIQEDVPACSTVPMTFHWTVTTINGCANDGQMNDEPAGWGSDYNNLKLDTLCLLESNVRYNLPGHAGFKVGPYEYYNGTSAGSGGCAGDYHNIGLHTMFYDPGTTDFASNWKQEFEDRLTMWTGFVSTTVDSFFPASPGPCDADPNRPGSQIELGIFDIEALPLRYHHFHTSYSIQCGSYCPTDTVGGLELFHKDRTLCGQRMLWNRLVDDHILVSPGTLVDQARVNALVADMISAGFWETSDPVIIDDIRDYAHVKFRVNCYNYYVWRFISATLDTARDISGCDTKWGVYGIPWRVNNNRPVHMGLVHGDAPTSYQWNQAWTFAVQDRKLYEAVDFFAPTMYQEFTDMPGTYKSGESGWLYSDSLDKWLVANFGRENEVNVTVTDWTEGGSLPTSQLCSGYFTSIQDLHGIYRKMYPFYTWRAKNQEGGTCSPADPNFMNLTEARRTLSAMWHMGVDGVLLWSHFYASGCQTSYPEDAASSKSEFMDPVVRDLLQNDYEQAPLCDFPLIAHDACDSEP